MKPYQFIPASSSPRRQELPASLGISFDIIKPDINEDQHPGEPPHQYVQRLSKEKAEAVACHLTDSATILAADTVVILAADTIGVTGSGILLGKPTDADDARQMLQSLRGRAHQVCTAFTLQQVDENPQSFTEMVCTQVTMRSYTDEEIDAYIATGDPFDKAGSYAIQHEGFHPVEHIEGSYTNVMGLPTEALQAALMRWGLIAE